MGEDIENDQEFQTMLKTVESNVASALLSCNLKTRDAVSQRCDSSPGAMEDELQAVAEEREDLSELGEEGESKATSLVEL